MSRAVRTDALRDTTIGSRSLTYDNNGNLTAIGTTTHTWDYKNRLTRTVGNSATTTYGYDHTGQRVWMATNGTATTTYINKWYDIFATKSGATTTATTSTSLFAGDTLVGSITTTSTNGAATTTPTISYIHTDHLNSTNVVTNASGTPTYTLDYLPYGERRVNTGTDTAQREYIGERYDEGTGLSYLNARYYEGSRGQFLSQDPVHLAIGTPGIEQLTGKSLQGLLADPQVLNSYSYARNNPIVNKDPDGKYLESGFDVAMLGLSIYQFSQDPSWTNAGAVFLDAGSVALPGIPAVGGMALRSGRVAGDAASILAKNRETGAIGEQAAGIIKNTEKIPSVTKPGTSRIPDVLSHSGKVIGDVKNVNYQSFTSQLRDFANYAQQNSYRFVLTVDQRTQLSQTFQQISQKIEIIRKDLNSLTKGKK